MNEIVGFFKGQDVDVFLYFNSQVPEPELISNAVDAVLGSGQNDGIAKAHQELISYANNNNYEYIVISDQDTKYPDTYIYEMLSLFNEYDDIVIGCPGWLNNNKNDGEPEKQYCLNGSKMVLETPYHGQLLSHGISSGMFVSLKKIDVASFIDGELFIDWVDNDFCWSLISEGYSIRYNKNVILNHSLGDAVKKSIFSNFTTRSPFRDYFIVRNALYIMLYKKYNLKCKRYLMIKLVTHIVFSLVFSKSFKTFFNRLFLLSKALYHSVIRKMGRLS
ncbi:glycosyltransferase [Shewanella sp. 10N.286.54.B9]|uniref:glycosyltransferase n=1 Tax=Shewanella sp. 10N.286.54.B9 TaxID=3229719 RepID=UPI00354EB4D2